MKFNIRIPQITLAAALTQIGTIISGATRSFMITELDFQGMGITSLGMELGLYRVGTAGVTGSVAMTPVPLEVPNMTGTTPAIAFSGTAFQTYATQPIAGALVHSFGLNSNGQRYFWRANPNLDNAILVAGGNNAAGSLALFPISGFTTGIVAGRIQIQEL